ncbi:MAG: hypothetical protein JSV65_11725 [Armatimonadota bacterium]|nr:MAG: hypothetical protein JSV65_11725 [Armatimonadota bacterium]
MVTFETTHLRIGFDDTGHAGTVRDVARGEEYGAAGKRAPLLTLVLQDREVPPTALSYAETDNRLRLSYGDTGITATIVVTTRPTHATLELEAVDGAAPNRIIWGPFFTTIGKTIGETVGVVRDDEFALGIQSLSIQTTAGAARTPEGSLLRASAIEHDGGVLGSKIALFGCPAQDALSTLGEIELAEGLPHPMLDGVWGKVSPTARRSYLITSFHEGNLDGVLELARKAGLTYVYDGGPFETWGHFQLERGQFPDGDESLRRCAEKAAKTGIRLGAHTLSGFITTNDPYITPVPDPRLARMGSTVLAGAVDGKAAEVPIADPTAFRNRQTLATAIIGDELVQYDAVSEAEPWMLLGCTRGAFGTAASPHPAGADIGKLADHDYRTFYPGIENGMMDEMTDRLVELFNSTGLRQISFDGLEGLSTYGYGEYARNRFVKQCFDGWKQEVINDASNLLHYLWHIHTRMNWGELTQSAKVDVDSYRANNCKYFEDNLFPPAMGWWRFGGAGLDWEATRLEDVEYLLAKAAGYNACHGMQAGPDAIAAHGYGEECLRMVKAWDEARYAGAFTDPQRERLRGKGRDFHLEAAGEKQWTLTEIKYSPFYWMCPGTGRSAPYAPERHLLSFTTASEGHLGPVCRAENPFERQPLRFELRVVGSFDYASNQNIELTPTAAQFKRDPGLHPEAPELKINRAQVNGLAGFKLSAAHGGDKPSGVIRAIATLPQPLDLSKHRGFGVWVRGDGKGELLFAELTSGDMKRQYYAPIDFTGERYFEFPLGEMCLGRYYAYDWNSWSGFANWWQTLKGFDYRRVDRITIGFNAILPGDSVCCAVAGIKALKELGGGLCNPSFELNGKRMSFDDTLAPGCYLVYDGSGSAQVRDAHYRLLREVAVTGDHLGLRGGENAIRVSYDGAGGPAPWARLEFKCVGPPERVAAR